MDPLKATPEQVKAAAKSRRMRMTEADFQAINPAGHKRMYRPDGSYEWRNSWRPNEGGKLTRTAEAINEGLRPAQKFDQERHSEAQARIERVKLVDSRGEVHYVESGRADASAQANGWGYSWKAGGLILKAGPDGMIFRLWRDEWEPTGRLEAAITGEECPTDTFQRDPDGNTWGYDDGEWRKFNIWDFAE